MSYLIVLFKNNKKKKVIKKYNNKDNALKKYNLLIKDNKNIVFEKKVENAEKVNYFLGLITDQESYQKTIVLKDSLGRNTVANIENSNYVFLDLQPFKKEELLYDWQTKNKISFELFIKTYFKNKELKSVFTLNNKICIQINEEVSIFSLKDSDESDRFLFIIEDYFIENNRSDAFFVRDISTPQRKWVYKVLEDKGFDKKQLYRLKTTFSKR